jgi:hypothetical protein
MDHTWENWVKLDAVIGKSNDPHRLTTIAPDPLALAITSQIAAFSLDHGCGVKFLMGVKWLRRCEENARQIEAILEDL